MSRGVKTKKCQNMTCSKCLYHKSTSLVQTIWLLRTLFLWDFTSWDHTNRAIRKGETVPVCAKHPGMSVGCTCSLLSKNEPFLIILSTVFSVFFWQMQKEFQRSSLNLPSFSDWQHRIVDLGLDTDREERDKLDKTTGYMEKENLCLHNLATDMP